MPAGRASAATSRCSRNHRWGISPEFLTCSASSLEWIPLERTHNHLAVISCEVNFFQRTLQASIRYPSANSYCDESFPPPPRISRLVSAFAPRSLQLVSTRANLSLRRTTIMLILTPGRYKREFPMHQGSIAPTAPTRAVSYMS